MRSAFRMGRLTVCPRFLATVPRPAMVAAIVSHFTTQPTYDGAPVRTEHEHCCIRFVVETPESRDKTTIRLEEP